MTYTFLLEPNIIHIATLVVLSFVKGSVHLSFEKKSKMICYTHYLLASPKKILVCITSIRNMRPPPFPHLHNHGLAMLVRTSPFRNMRPLPVY
jgi:hypothetical protein